MLKKKSIEKRGKTEELKLIYLIYVNRRLSELQVNVEWDSMWKSTSVFTLNSITCVCLRGGKRELLRSGSHFSSVHWIHAIYSALKHRVLPSIEQACKGESGKPQRWSFSFSVAFSINIIIIMFLVCSDLWEWAPGKRLGMCFPIFIISILCGWEVFAFELWCENSLWVWVTEIF